MTSRFVLFFRQVGAWGCFDEFNRLEERMLSAVSQQIQAIQECLKAKAIDHGRGNSGSQHTVELIGKQVQVNTDMAIFITMNPDYAGLPTHSTQLFSVDFSRSRIGVKKCVFNKRTIKVCVSCCRRCPGTSALSAAPDGVLVSL